MSGVQHRVGHPAVGPEELDGDVEHRQFDVLTALALAAGVERRRDREGCHPRGRLVDDPVAHEVGDRDLRVHLEGDVARHRLHDRVVDGAVGVGARRSVTRHRAVDDVRIHGSGPLPPDAPAFHHPGAHVLHDDVAVGDQVEHEVATGVLLDVDLDRLLPPVVVDDGAVEAALRELGEPGEVAEVGRLDLHDVGTQIAEQHAGQRPGDDLGHVDDPDSLQRTRHVALLSLCVREHVFAATATLAV